MTVILPQLNETPTLSLYLLIQWHLYIVNFCLYYNKVPYCILILFLQLVYSGKVIYLIIILLTANGLTD